MNKLFRRSIDLLMRLSVFLLIFMLQFPYGMVSILGSIFLKESIEINSMWDRDLDLLEELEEREIEIEYRPDWALYYRNSSTEKGFKVKPVCPELFFPAGCGFLPDIPPEVYFFC